MDNATVARILNAANIHEQIEILLRKGYTYSWIIQVLHVSSKTITKVKHSIDNGEPIPEVGKRGQPTKKTSEVITITIEETVNNPRLSASALQLIIQSKTGISISITKILEIRKDAGYYYSPPKCMPNLCYSILKHKEIIPFIGFSDESRFCMCNDSKWVWVKRSEYNEKAYVKKNKFPTNFQNIITRQRIT